MEGLQEVFSELMELSNSRKPYIGRSAAVALISSCMIGKGEKMGAWSSRLVDLLLSKEQKISLAETVCYGCDSDDENARLLKQRMPANSPTTRYNRALALLSVEWLPDDADRGLTNAIIKELLEINFDDELTKLNPMTGTMWYVGKNENEERSDEYY